MNLTDRCDAASSGSEPGTHYWILPGVGELRLCGHHNREHGDVLMKEGWVQR